MIAADSVGNSLPASGYPEVIAVGTERLAGINNGCLLRFVPIHGVKITKAAGNFNLTENGKGMLLSLRDLDVRLYR
jgi:hypothetical protein